MSSRNGGIPNPSAITNGDRTHNPSLELEPGMLYITLFRMEKDGTYHWALVVATTNRTGMVYHNTNDGDGFYLSRFLHPHLLNSTRFLTAVKVSRLTDYERKFHEEFHTRIGEVPIEGHTCRTWLLEALFEVSDQGLIDLQPNKAQISQIETEALDHAIRAARRRGVATVVTSFCFET
ncbi:hypothetical protein TRV_07410 [Trichophyton verrucosum HKI 0517]|uniref:Uncharacterized protein n=1 Tax=Trichophyton verrucosum (strain HKI 0517) TaxID=663202 RepID=D4DJP2_TRIVH|nr:uncharacterized protein TRV_07410 [Trichophyton verrucosum HKI 0517]EFE37920.1 hypothetical protein TRV_07410 [Trichophyton verrucosum HKI 0517]